MAPIHSRLRPLNPCAGRAGGEAFQPDPAENEAGETIRIACHPCLRKPGYISAGMAD